MFESKESISDFWDSFSDDWQATELESRQIIKELKRQRKRSERAHISHIKNHEPLPLTQEHLDKHDGYFPRVKNGSPSDSSAARKQLDNLAEHGALVLLTLDCRIYDDLPLKSQELAATCHTKIDLMCKVLDITSGYKSSIQRGGKTGHTHIHFVTVLGQLPGQWQEQLKAVSAGKNGGTMLHGRLHGVIVKATDKDFARLASYLSRDADGRFDLEFDSVGYLQAHEDELQRKKGGNRSPRLGRYSAPRLTLPLPTL